MVCCVRQKATTSLFRFTPKPFASKRLSFPTPPRSMSLLINDADFKEIISGLSEIDEKREILIKRSRDVQRWSKQAIFSLHRNQFSEATSRLTNALNTAKEVNEIVEAYPLLRQGSFSSALEEFAEAKVFEHYLLDSTLLPKNKIPLINIEEYLGGVLDFTGELVRHAIQKATIRDVPSVTKARNLVEDLMKYFLMFDFRNSPLRKKFDGLKYSLQKLENTLYELSLGKGGDALSKDEEGMQPNYE